MCASYCGGVVSCVYGIVVCCWLYVCGIVVLWMVLSVSFWWCGWLCGHFRSAIKSPLVWPVGYGGTHSAPVYSPPPSILAKERPNKATYLLENLQTFANYRDSVIGIFYKEKRRRIKIHRNKYAVFNQCPLFFISELNIHSCRFVQ